MKFRLLFSLALLPAMALSVAAQTPTPAAPAAGAPAAAKPAPAPASVATQVPKMRVGIIAIAAFRENVGDMRVKYEKLQAEFAPISNKLASIQVSIEEKEKTLQTNFGKMTPAQQQRLAEEIEGLKKTLQRETEDAQAQAQRREAEETAPVFEKINRFMAEYAQKRGLTVVLEAGGMGPAIVYASAAANITEDFIREYNKANPTPTVAAAPATQPAGQAAAPKPTPAATGRPAPATGGPRATGTRRPGA
ncbi:MAG: OmpH family outer membrane protein [Blastocatellia bacterium]